MAITARILAFPLDEKVWTPQHRKEFEEHQLTAEAQEVLRSLALWKKLKLTPAHDPFVGGMMHDIGKVALIQSYPGLYPVICEELQRENWNVTMRSVEDLLAGGAHHNMVGAILSESWKLGPMLTKLVEEHHTPAPDDPFTQLIALADFMGGYIYPYPKKSEYPMTKMLQEEGMQADPEPPEGYDAATADAREEDAKAPTADESATTAAGAKGGEEGQEGEREEAEKPPGASAGLSPGTAVWHFLPPNLLQRLDIDIHSVIAAARLIKPTVERLTEEIRKSA